MAKVYLIPKKQFNTRVSRIDGVRDAVKSQAETVKRRAVANHAPFIDPNNNHVTRFSVTQGDVDSFANMDHRAAMAYEFGWTTKNGKDVPGRYVLTRAALGL